MLFTDRMRGDSTPKREGERDVAFLERSGLPGIACVRELLTGCLSRYPETHRAELVARMRSGADANWRSATFELLLHECLARLQFEVEPHPALPSGIGAKPDFKVTGHDALSFYIEAVNAGEDDGRDPSAEARKAATLETLARGNHRSFMVSVESEGDPKTQPKGRELLERVLRWLDGLSVEQIRQVFDSQSWDALPVLVWVHEDWVVKIRPIPLPPEHQGKPGTLLGFTSLGTGFVDSGTPIREAVRRKGSKYGSLGAPLVVAVNSGAFNLDDRDVSQALFGRERYHMNIDNLAATPRADRARDGAWIGPAGPRSRRVSGVWAFSDLTPYTAAARQHTLYVNPWALQPVPPLLLQLPHARVEGGELALVAGLSLRDALGLPDGWPR